MSNRQRRKRRANKGLVVLSIVLAVVLALLIGVTAVMEGFFGLMNDPDEDREYMSQEEYMEQVRQEEDVDPDYTGPVEDPDDIQWSAAESIGQGKNIVNILLIGQDKREGQGRSRSDAMILCTINKTKKTITMTSFMRDMYVQIPGYQDNRINASYALGGMELLDSCLNKNFGVTVDGNVEIDFSGFQKAIDILGGVDIELTAAEAEYLNKRGNWDLENNAGQWSLTEGVNCLNGSQALAFSRIRKVGNGDFGRTNRQRVVLSTLIEKAKHMTLPQAYELLTEILPLLTTDMSDAQILGLAVEMFPMLSELTINTQQMPADGAYYMTMIRGMSVLRPNMDKNRAILKEIMAEE